MDYSARVKSLLKEVFSAKQYKLLSPAAKVFAFIGVFPFIAYATLLTIAYNVYVFLFNVLSSSVNYLENWQKKKKDDSSWFGEGILYLITFPFIFFNQVLLSFMSISFFFIWFFMQCTFYIATLGGIRWQPYITKIDNNDTTKYIATTNKRAGNVLSIILGSAIILYIVLLILNLITEISAFAISYSILDWIYSLGAVISVPIVFKKRAVSSIDDDEDAISLNDEDDDYFTLPTL